MSITRNVEIDMRTGIRFAGNCSRAGRGKVDIGFPVQSSLRRLRKLICLSRSTRLESITCHDFGSIRSKVMTRDLVAASASAPRSFTRRGRSSSGSCPILIISATIPKFRRLCSDFPVHHLKELTGKWSEWRDSNPRPLVPQTSALTGLRYTPTFATYREGTARAQRRAQAPYPSAALRAVATLAHRQRSFATARS